MPIQNRLSSGKILSGVALSAALLTTVFSSGSAQASARP